MRSEDGSITTFVVVIAVALVLLLGLVVDGGRVMAARIEVQGIASAAARAATNEIDYPAYVADSKTWRVDPPRAIARAQSFAAAEGATATARVKDGKVEVEATKTVSMTILNLGGIGNMTVRGESTARPALGINKEGD